MSKIMTNSEPNDSKSSWNPWREDYKQQAGSEPSICSVPLTVEVDTSQSEDTETESPRKNKLHLVALILICFVLVVAIILLRKHYPLLSKSNFYNFPNSLHSNDSSNTSVTDFTFRTSLRNFVSRSKDNAHLTGVANIFNQLITASNVTVSCPKEHFRCSANSKCISVEQLCDNFVDCPGAEDETDCPCATRISDFKFCDGYKDCFDGSDENFCDWCPSSYFRCGGDNKCIPGHKVCDFQQDCHNTQDEISCYQLSPNEEATTNGTRLREGFLLRNIAGNWYPICANPSDEDEIRLTDHACASITNNPLSETTYVHRQFSSSHMHLYGGMFLYHYLGKFIPWNSCFNNQGIYVTCTEMKCGINLGLLSYGLKGRIVGGTESRPGSWPWHAAVYKSGSYSCGATLISSQWLISAAHCFVNFKEHYYEVQLGALRRRSNSPFQQIHRVSHIIMHTNFSLLSLNYDIALIRTETTVTFDFHVRPICLSPEDSEVHPGTFCTATGWGDKGEDAEDSEELQEVILPVTNLCPNKERWLCAGFPAGGRDACQGDSGGPFMCLQKDGFTWYLAGIISAGLGCARPATPGMYTKVSYFRDWIAEGLRSPLPKEIPLVECPGLRCHVMEGGLCLKTKDVCDGFINCYNAEDEALCWNKKPVRKS